MVMNSTKKTNPWGKWIYWFLFAVAVITVYKTLDNFTDVTQWFSNLLGILMPFSMGILIAGLLYMPAKKIENLYRKLCVFISFGKCSNYIYFGSINNYYGN